MSFLLLKEIEKLLEHGFSQTVFRVPDQEPGEYISPQFFIGALPAKRTMNDPLYDNKSDFPFIVNRFQAGEDSTDESIVRIKTICGIYTAGDVSSGEQDIINMVFRCRRLILEKHLLDNMYELQLPLRYSFGDAEDQHNQAHPYYGAAMVSTWVIPQINRIFPTEEEVRIYGTSAG